MMTENQVAFQRLVDIVAELRKKCPWDRKQTKESIRHLTIEETYELSDAILENDYAEMKVELGDLLMHTIFYASMAEEAGEFSLAEALQTQIDKLIRRHPHIYGDLQGASEAEIKANWEQIKAQERAEKGEDRRSALDGVPESLPSLIKAQRMQEKAANMGFDWQESEAVWEKVEEEIREFREAPTHEEQEAEMGDLLFALINYCRHKGINAEDALSKSSRKFKQRYHYIETQGWDKNKQVSDMSLEEMDRLWEEAKEKETHT
ncbi:MAG: nucleoside triphosphate pyrophosphohydrolase [Bacteroidota bacterium]